MNTAVHECSSVITVEVDMNSAVHATSTITVGVKMDTAVYECPSAITVEVEMNPTVHELSLIHI